MKRENMPANKIHQEWMLEEILKLQKDTPDSEPSFTLDQAKFNRAVEIMFKHGLISRPVKFTELTERKTVPAEITNKGGNR